MVNDLTKGKTSSVLLKFTLPLLVSVVFQQLYNIADSVIAGRFAGEDALAAVGASYPITNIFNAVAVGCNIGCSVVISQYFGAGNYKKVKTAVSTSVIASIFISLLLTALGIGYTVPLMKMISTPENIFPDASLYLKIYIGGFLFLFIYNIANGIFASLGDSKTPLYFLIASSVGNVVLDYVFVVYFKMGVAGVAWATFIAQGAAGLLSVVALKKRVSSLKTDGRHQLFSWVLLRRIARISIPSVLQQSFVSVGNIFIQSIINSFGSSVIAGYSAAIKLNTFSVNTLCTFGNGISSFTAQNVGAGKPERIREGLRHGVLYALISSVVIGALYVVLNRQFILIFMEGDGGAAAVEAGTSFLKIVAPFYFVVGYKIVCDGVLRGTGTMKLFMTATLTDLVIRVILAYVFSPIWGVKGVWYSWPVGWIAAALLSVFFCRYVIKMQSSKPPDSSV